MAFERGRFGVEFDPRQRPEHPPWLPRLVLFVLAAAFLSLTVTLINRFLGREPAPPVRLAVTDPVPPAADRTPPPAPPKLPVAGTRPVEVRNLLMRLEEAERRRDIEMAARTIESLRALPGNPAADLDDALAKRLGVLNLKRLFANRSRLWTKEIAVRRGDTVERIAFEHGSTAASLRRLNGDPGRLSPGMKLTVMDHPRFSLNIYRLTKTADLSIKGRFFKRYYLRGPVKGAVGAYATAGRLDGFFAEYGVTLAPADLEELELLLPGKTPVVISEFR